MIYYYSLFTAFVILITMMIIDQNVAEYIVLLTKLLKSKIERLYWMIRFHPIVFSSPIGKWLMMRKYIKISKDIEKNIK
jgi:hypothetical protein